MTITRRKFITTSASLGLLGIAGKPAFAQASTFNYKVATNVQSSHSIFIHLTEASEKIRKDTDGKVNIRIFPNGQLGSDTDTLSQLRSGAVEMFTLSGLILSTLVPVASINGIGFAFKDYDQVWPAMDGKLGALVRGEIAKRGL